MRRYLVVDDNAELAENVAEILCDLGDHAVGISDPKQALEGLGLLQLPQPRRVR